MNPLLEALYSELDEDCPQSVERLDGFNWESSGVRDRYVIAITPRCGSTWLMYRLAATGLCGRPGEYFNNDAIPATNRQLRASSFTDYFERVVRAFQSSAAFGFEINFNRMRWLSELVDFESTFVRPGVRFVTLFRRDLLAQAISVLKAIKTGVWHRGSADGRPIGPGGEPQEVPATKLPDLEDGEIWSWILGLVQEEMRWERFLALHELAPLRLCYEDLVTSPSYTVLRILRHVVPTQLAETPDSLHALLGAEDHTQRLVDSHSWWRWSRFFLDYSADLEIVLQTRRELDIGAFQVSLRERYGVETSVAP